jgi:glycerophosphoryl diester phosphodiesterase
MAESYFTKLISLSSLLVASLSIAEPIVIAHRGASGYLPEHSMESKVLAFTQGVDYIEQDVVMTKDNELVVLHDLILDHVSDVKQKFPNRSRNDGHFYVIDFTLAELQYLKLTERITSDEQPVYPERFPVKTSQFTIHTLGEEIQLIQVLNKMFDKDIGIYPEIKSPFFHMQQGKDLSAAVLKELKNYGYDSKEDKVYLQSFDPNELKRIRTELLAKYKMDIPLIQLVAYTDWNEVYESINGQVRPYSYDSMFTELGVKALSKYVDGVGVWYPMITQVEKNENKPLIKPSAWYDMLRRQSLPIHVYTFRADKNKLPNYVESYEQWVQLYQKDIVIEGYFTDFPDKTIAVLKQKTQSH